ncbi:MAG: C4-dicarboxylate ABC transporter substrate-binding protein [Alphaproteobacteria bacterium]|nr:C4-dicarboxylate ABC transporter substrate-binding protein [Alphaproteobacteria bacterium]
MRKFTGTLAILAALLASGYALAQDKPIVWRYQTTLVETRQEMEPIREWAKRIGEASKGRLKIELYYGGALGINQSDELRAVRQGAVEAAQPYFGYLARDLPEASLAVVQGALLTPDEAVKVAPTIQAIFKDAYEKWNAKVIAWQMSPIFDMSIMCKEPIDTLAKLKGKKLRVWSREQVDAYGKLGVAAQIIPQNDTYMALQTGVVDCAIYVLGNAKTVSFQEVTKYSSQLHTFAATPNPIIVNAKIWAELPDDLKKVVLDAGEWLRKTSLDIAKSGPETKEREAQAEFAKTGQVKVLSPFPAEDKKRFYDAVLEVWKDRAAEKGAKAMEYREQMIAALQKIRSQ